MTLRPTYRPSVNLIGVTSGSIEISGGEFEISVSLVPSYLASVSPVFVGGGGGLTAQTLYGTDGTDGALRAGPGLNMTLGPNASYITLTAVGDFYPVPDVLDESDTAYFYFGWQIGDLWRVEKQIRASSQSTYANVGNNQEIDDLAEAWPERYSLNYA